MTALSHALECAAAHGWAVFPASQHKAPNTPNGHKAASTDPERIRAMWGQYGGLLIGIRTGQASNLAVLDIDRQHNGANWWREASRYRLPATRVHRTRSGGLHLYFKHRPDLRCSTARIAPRYRREGRRWRDYLLALSSEFQSQLQYNVFNTISCFKQLQSFDFTVKESDDGDQEMEVEEHFSSQSLKDCQNLTHLKLCVFWQLINDSFFDDIDLYLPKLKRLELVVHLMSDKGMHSLAKLKKLESISIDSCCRYITIAGVCHVINNCHQIKSIHFNSRANITHKTIEELIKLAKSKHKIQFRHCLKDIENEDNFRQRHCLYCN